MSQGTAAKVTALTIVFGLVATGKIALATDVVMVEEHWELTVGGPEVDKSCPQISLVMSPTENLDSDHFVFTLNHATFPDFVAGGLQLQHWDGNEVVELEDASDTEILHHDNEVVSWKQRMWIQDGRLRMKVFDGTSQTWGGFGHWHELYISTPTDLTRLNEYRPAISLTESGITYAGNRVSSLVLQKLIWQTSDGQTFELTAPIDIDTHIDP